MGMGNLAKGIEAEAGDEQVLFAVIGRHDDDELSDKPIPGYVGKLLPWKEARPIIDYEYNNSLGTPECHPVYAWTETKVVFVTEYEGSTTIAWVPRNPTEGKPEFGGQ